MDFVLLAAIREEKGGFALNTAFNGTFTYSISISHFLNKWIRVVAFQVALHIRDVALVLNFYPTVFALRFVCPIIGGWGVSEPNFPHTDFYHYPAVHAS